MSINTITLSGRLVAAPELRYTTNGTAVASGRIAVDDGYGEQKKTYFFDYNAWTPSTIGILFRILYTAGKQTGESVIFNGATGIFTGALWA